MSRSFYIKIWEIFIYFFFFYENLWQTGKNFSCDTFCPLEFNRTKVMSTLMWLYMRMKERERWNFKFKCLFFLIVLIYKNVYIIFPFTFLQTSLAHAREVSKILSQSPGREGGFPHQAVLLRRERASFIAQRLRRLQKGKCRWDLGNFSTLLLLNSL